MGREDYGIPTPISLLCARRAAMRLLQPRGVAQVSTGDITLRIRKRRQTETPVVRRYDGQEEFDRDRPRMASGGMHVASIGTDPEGGIRVVWSPHRRYSIEVRSQRESVEPI